MEEAISMASKYLDMCPPVLASLKAGTPIIATVSNTSFEAVRLFVKTAGVGQTLGFLHVKAYD